MATKRRAVAGDGGTSFIEIATAMCVALTLSAFALPLTRVVADESRARQAAAFAAARLRDARQQAVTRSASSGLVFDRAGDRWTFRVCADGNANGLKRADLGTGRDVCASDAIDLATLFPGVRIAVDGRLRGPEGDAPSPDAVRFGSTDIASFSPSGGCTSGSLYLQSARGTQYAVRIAGGTSRARVLRFDAAAGLWREL